MLESAEIGHKISKQVYARKEPPLRKALLNAQFDLSQTRRGPVLIILSGVHAGGRGETANKLTEWMDPRHIRVVAFGPRTPEETERCRVALNMACPGNAGAKTVTRWPRACSASHSWAISGMIIGSPPVMTT